jgi:2-polyprenyl-6-methoxyphenol hydroxylase-like FAD-dependent oxidoreductase
MKRIGEHAVVIGASMGGLLAARALADFYGQVTVLERDAFPVADIPRKDVPQGKHAHGLLARSRAVIEEFFLGWTDEVVGCGGVRGDIAGDVNWIGHGVTIKSAPSDLVGLLAARPVLEGNLRRRLLALPISAIRRPTTARCSRPMPAHCRRPISRHRGACGAADRFRHVPVSRQSAAAL